MRSCGPRGSGAACAARSATGVLSVVMLRLVCGIGVFSGRDIQ